MEPVIDSRRTLLPYVLTVLGLVVLTQVVIALDGGRVGLPAAIAVGVIALVYAWYLLTRGAELRRLRFGPYVAHAATFVIVVTAFHLHLFVRAVLADDAVAGTPHFPLDEGWFGAVVAMTAFWGLGLLAHTVAAIGMRGYEDRR